jgi:hypothetical protein
MRKSDIERKFVNVNFIVRLVRGTRVNSGPALAVKRVDDAGKALAGIVGNIAARGNGAGKKTIRISVGRTE